MNKYVVAIDGRGLHKEELEKHNGIITVNADGFEFDEVENLIFFKLKATEFEEDEFVMMFGRGHWLRIERLLKNN